MISPPFAVLTGWRRMLQFHNFLTAIQAAVWATTGIILFGPPFLHFVCGHHHEQHLIHFLNIILSMLSLICGFSIWPAAFVANYAYLLGSLFSLGDPLGVNNVVASTTVVRYSDVTSLTAKQAARVVVAMAFNSGRAHSLIWPPQYTRPGSMLMVALQDNKLGSALLHRVYPVVMVVIVFPALLVMFYTTTRQISHRLSIHRLCCVFRSLVAVPTTTTSVTVVTAVDTTVNSSDPASSGTPSLPENSANESELSPSHDTAQMHHNDDHEDHEDHEDHGDHGDHGEYQPPSNPQTLLRSFGIIIFKLLQVVSGTLAEGAVETLAPFVLGAIVIVTLAMTMVLFGVGHVGVDSLVQSGVFGLTKDAVDTLLELVKMQWRFLRQMRWSWWLETAVRYERRYENTAHHHVHGNEVANAHAHADNHAAHDHGYRGCMDTNCPFHIYGHSTHSSANSNTERNHADDGENVTAEQPKEPGRRIKKRRHCRLCRHFHRHYHHHHHHHHGEMHQQEDDQAHDQTRHQTQHQTHHQAHHHRQNTPGSHIVLESRRDWLRWFFGQPHRTASNDFTWPAPTMATAAAEVAEGFFGRPLEDMDGPHNDAWGMFDHQSREEHGSYSDHDPRHLPSQYHQQNTQPDLWASDLDDFLTVEANQHARAFCSQQPDDNSDETDDVSWVNIANGSNVDHFDDNDSVTRDPFVRDEDASEYNAGGVARDYANASRLDGYDVDGNNFDRNYRSRYRPWDDFPGSGNTSDDGDAFGRTVQDTMLRSEVVDSGSETFGSNSNHRTVSNFNW